jgi:hypothetical protein
MASKRDIKKKIKSETDELIEDAFIESINGDKKEAGRMDGIIDEIIDYRYDLLGRVSNHPKGNRAKVKDHFNAIRTDLSTKNTDYSKKIGRVKK